MASRKMKVPIRTPNEKEWSMAIESHYTDEEQLHEMVHKNPEIIPFEDIDPESEKLKKVSIKELGLPGSGKSDVVVIDQSGGIYVIEAKLATNDDIRRKVVGQVLEYAAYLWEQDFEWFDNKVREKVRRGLSECFQNAPGWVKENFEESVTNNLQEGSFKLIIVVDKITKGLRRITEFTRKRGLAIYPVELRYFKDKNGTEVLVPTVFNAPSAKKVTPPPRRVWNEESFFDDAANKVDERTLSTLRKMYAFSKDLARPREVNWGHGAVDGTFTASVVVRDKPVTLYTIQSSGRRNWLNKKGLMELVVDGALIVEYIQSLKSLGLDENKKWDSMKYPEFNTSVLNDDEKFASFKEATLKLKKALAQS